jgi:glycosyltransferase involved in cell wall biosynthesis
MPKDWDGSGHYRCLHPANQLMLAGHDVEVPPHKVASLDGRRITPIYGAWTTDGRYVPVSLALKHRPRFDLMVVQPRDEPGVAKWLTSELGTPYVVDRDDAMFKIPAYNPGWKRDPKTITEMLAQIRGAAAMTVSTPAIAEEMAPYCDDITVIRNTLDWRMWERAPQQSEVERRRVRVGYMGDARWHSGDLKELRGVLGPWLERNPNVEFVAVGGSPSQAVHDLLEVPPGQRVNVQETEFHRGDLADITACFDIGLVPLARNSMNECKSHLKGLEYAACGIPCIATPTESYRWWKEQCPDGVMLADRPAQWTTALDVLVHDDGVRRAMGRDARAAASRHTIQRHYGAWEAVYERVCGVDSHAAREAVSA